MQGQWHGVCTEWSKDRKCNKVYITIWDWRVQNVHSKSSSVFIPHVQTPAKCSFSLYNQGHVTRRSIYPTCANTANCSFSLYNQGQVPRRSIYPTCANTTTCSFSLYISFHPVYPLYVIYQWSHWHSESDLCFLVWINGQFVDKLQENCPLERTHWLSISP
jgi:hypothetical protein